MTTKSDFSLTEIAQQLNRQGYVVLESILNRTELDQMQSDVDALMAREREEPFDPGDGPPAAEDAQIEAFLADSYQLSKEELARTMRRIRHTRAQNHNTSWPVGPKQMNKTFLHIPLLMDNDRSQYVRNLPAKTSWTDRLVVHPVIHGLARRLLGEDCILGDVSATSIGPHTNGGPWHLDNPLTHMPEPLPDFPLGFQVGWMIDPFTQVNGATRVIPRSHLTRRKPDWKKGDREGELALTGPAGSVAIWIGGTWHRSGPNATDKPRRAIISFYQCAWIKPFSEYRPCITPQRASRMSPAARYLYGFSAYGMVRG